ncbi:uncharacterized protein QC763_707835 [Podospora pseudopauciseta]|uniref:Uncharacterized protein n=1 Tax=Podospora pseudopauciseta TaxID=2093780 RepID=A0ABR0H1F4_9PEZI|nr:hypothetical protein QC763_707835 [Podospora pseudopauciseta]
MALPVTSIMMPRACLAAARPLQRILVGASSRTHIPPLPRHHTQQVRLIRYRLAKREDANPKLLFTGEDIPSLDVWDRLSERAIARRIPPEITSEQMYEAVRSYCSIAIHNNNSWQPRLQSEFGIEPIVLHYAAISLSPLSDHKLCIHMLSTASSLGYHPSTISVMFFLSQISDFFDARLKPPFRDISARFRLLSRTSRDPDILTVQGLLALREDDQDAALRFFEQAIIAAEKGTGILPPLVPGDFVSDGDTKEVPGRPLRFSYEKSCYYNLGRLYKRKGQTAKARDAFVIAAADLRHIPALVDHARMVELGQTAEENKYREVLLVSGAKMGNVKAFRQMVVDLLIKYENPEKYSPKEFKEDPVDVRVIWEWCILTLGLGRTNGPFAFADKDEFERVHNAIRGNRARMSLVEQDAETEEVTLAIWVYPSKIANLGNLTGEPERFDITI